MGRSRRPPDTPLFPNLPEHSKPAEVRAEYSGAKVWTESKALLIQRYLYYFVLVTKHGTYIDGFAGPQDPDQATSWSAKLVLDNRPPWLRHFHLFDIKAKQARRLEALKAAQPTHDENGNRINRKIQVRRGDFNELVVALLDSGSIGPKEATFCLLDQRTFECRWSTLQTLASYKQSNKIELFYFLPNHWLARAIAAQKDEAVLEDWWGRDDYGQLRQARGFDRSEMLCKRFKEELGYTYATPLPIYQKETGGAVMYWMIHAADHPDAPKLMARAYSRAVSIPLEQDDPQLALPIEKSS